MTTTRLGRLLCALVLIQPGIPAQQDLTDLLARMTLEEKIGQMTQLTLGAISKVKGTSSQQHVLDLEKLEHAIVARHVGSILNTCDIAFPVAHWRKVVSAIQDAATKRSRLKVPVLYGVDAVHGANYTRESTLFPQSIGLAATWSPELVEQIGRVTARDLRVCGTPWNFAPVVDVGRMPLWSRFFETFGEDVHLVRTLGTAAVRGNQGADLAGPNGVAACLKHFVGYSFPLSGKDRTPAWIPMRMLREYFLPPFQAAIEAGARTLMVNSGEINGIPVHSSRWLLTDLLRAELGFEGVVVTDWADISKLCEMHRVAPDIKEATRLAVHAGIDLCMVPEDFQFTDALIALVREGKISERRIDASVRRLLRLKRDLGLFDQAYPVAQGADQVGGEKDRALSLRAARESITLLTNVEGALPLTTSRKVAIVGPGATSVPMLHGGWSYTWQGAEAAAYPKDLRTVAAALEAACPGARTLSSETTATPERLAQNMAEHATDVFIYVIGETPSVEKPGDIEDLALPAAQLAEFHRIADTKKPVIVVILAGRPRIIREIVPRAKAVLHAYLPGPAGGQAIADVVFGTVNPSGRLPFTYPRYSGSLVPYDHKESARFDNKFGKDAFRPQFEFGHGLSYTTFAYDALKVSPQDVTSEGTLTVSVRVKNTGKRRGAEVVRVFVRDEHASVTPPVKRLRAFRRLELAPGAARAITFEIRVRDLAFVGRDLAWTVEPGAFTVKVGGLEAPLQVKASK